MKKQDFLTAGLMLILGIPIMLICGAITSYLLGTIISAWSVEGGNLQILGFLFELFGVPRHITVMIGQFLIAEIVLIGSVFGLVFITNSIATKYLSKINLIAASMIFGTVIGVGILFLGSSVEGIFKIIAILNIFLILYISSKVVSEDQILSDEEKL